MIINGKNIPTVDTIHKPLADSKKKSLFGKLLPIFIVCLIEGLVFAGWYSLTEWTKVPLNGSVISSSSQVVTDAVITVGNQKSYTDGLGNFSFSNIQYGDTNITVKSPTSGEISSPVSLKLRTGNRITLKLEPLKTSTIQGKIILPNNATISQFVVSIDAKKSELSSSGEFKFEGIPLGKKQLKIKSDETDFEQNIDINSELTNLPPIDLNIEVEKKLKVTDWYTKEALEGVNVNYGKEKSISNTQGEVVITKFQAASSQEISLLKEGYANKSTLLGVESTISIPRKGELLYIKKSNDQSKLIESNLDGSNEKILSSDELSVIDFSVVDGVIYFVATAGGESRDSFDNAIRHIYYINKEDKTEKKLFSSLGVSTIVGGLKREIISLNTKSIISVEQTIGQVLVTKRGFDEKENTEILKLTHKPDELLNIVGATISPDGKYLAAIKEVAQSGELQKSIRLISLGDGGKKINQNLILGDKSQEIEGMLGFSSNSNLLVFESSKSARDKVLQTFDITNNQINEFTAVNFDRYNAKIYDNKLFYLDNKELKSVDLITKEIQPYIPGFKVDNFKFYKNEGFVLESNNSLWYFDKELKGTPSLIQSTNKK
jgi:hypothetical protein